MGYAVLGPIAAGAFSTILRCKATATGELVAVKGFDNLKCATSKDVGDARDRELGVLRALAKEPLHPHIANMLAELGDTADDTATYAVLQFAEGGSLKRYMETPSLSLSKGARDDAAREGLPPPIVAVGTRQLAAALAHLHGLGICHRDVKPANILLASVANLTPSSLHLSLCDFGFACVCGKTGGAHERLTKEFCTPQYAAPEIASPADAHRGYLGRPVDMWALGCVVYEMLHRKPAFKAEERYELEGLVRNCRFQPFSKFVKVPPDAKALIRQLLVPEHRRPTAEQILRESPWISEEAAAARAAERELERQRAVEEEELERLKRAQGAFGL